MLQRSWRLLGAIENVIHSKFQEFNEPENVALGNGSVVKAMESRSVQMNVLFPGTKTKKAALFNVLCVP